MTRTMRERNRSPLGLHQILRMPRHIVIAGSTQHGTIPLSELRILYPNLASRNNAPSLTLPAVPSIHCSLWHKIEWVSVSSCTLNGSQVEQKTEHWGVLKTESFNVPAY